MIRLLFFILPLSCSFFVQGQSLRNNNHRTIGIGIHSNGWAANYCYFKDFNFFNGITIGYHNQNNLADRKTNVETITNTRMVLNKINNLYFIRAGIVKVHHFGERQDKANIGASAVFAGGPLLAIYKPIYVEYSSSDSAIINLQKVRYNPAIHNANQIFDRGSFTDGLFQSKLRPGLWMKTSMRFDWGSYQSNFKALEVGVNLNFVTGSIPTIFSKNSPRIYANMFMMLNFGAIKG